MNDLSAYWQNEKVAVMGLINLNSLINNCLQKTILIKNSLSALS